VKAAIMQPYLFPYIGYFQLLRAVDRFVIYDDVTFIKQGWINRNRILINGAAAFITIPLKHRSSHRLICDTEIDDSLQNRCWNDKLLKSVSNAYRRAPQFAAVFPLVEEVLSAPPRLVGDVARASIEAVARFLDIPTPLVRVSIAHVKGVGTGERRVIDICRAEGAAEYINAIGGTELYDVRMFREKGLQLRFLRSRPLTYPQFRHPFVANLSIIDVLMFNAPDVVRGFLDEYDLV
jgi:hypothetical protein